VAGGGKFAPGFVGQHRAFKHATAFEGEGSGQFDETGGRRDRFAHCTTLAITSVALAPSATSSSRAWASRSPGLAPASPEREMRAISRTRAWPESFCAGIRP